MANKVIKYDDFYRGDTPVFAFTFSEPAASFDWSGVRIDTVITSVATPTDNTGAAVLRTNHTLTVDSSNNASYEMQPTDVESAAFVPGTTYHVQAQLKDNSGANIATAVTGTVKILQDYII